MLILYLLTLLLPLLLLLVVPVGVYAALRSWSQALKWEAGLVLASVAALLGYNRMEDIFGPPLPVPDSVQWALKILAVLGPICLAAAWSRWSGVNWRLSLLLIPLVPLGMLAITVLSEFPFAS